MFILTVAGKENDGAYSVIDDDGDQTIIYLNKSITVANNATLSFRNDPAHVKSFELQGSSNYTSANFNNTGRNYECSNWASQTCNLHWIRDYRYTFSITTVAGSDLVTHSSSTSTTPAQNQKILDGYHIPNRHHPEL